MIDLTHQEVASVLAEEAVLLLSILLWFLVVTQMHKMNFCGRTVMF